MLAASDCTSPINGISYLADRYSFRGVEGEAITIEAMSTGINGPLYVYLLHADGTQVASSGVGNTPPTVVSIPSGGGSFTLPTTDTYLIEVSSSATGSYLLTLGGPSTPYTMTGAVPSGGPLAGVTITFSVVAGPGAVPTAVTTDAAGVWSQTGFVPGTVYRATPSLSAYVFSPVSADFDAPGVANFTGYPITCSAFTVTPITVGQTVSGMLAANDCTSPINGISYHADRYSFSGVEGEAFTIEATSTDINGYLYVYLLHADGTQVTSSVGYGPPTVVSIPSGGGSFTLPATGTYLIEVSSYATGSGSYLLTLGGPSTPYTMAGAVISGGPLAGVTITFSVVAGPGAVPTAVTTGAAGMWCQAGFVPGKVYRATPSLP